MTLRRSHQLPFKPVVTIGAAGLSEAVLMELGLALDHHELIKVKTGADLVQQIGHTAVLYRARPA